MTAENNQVNTGKENLNPRISVAIVTRNRYAELCECLRSLSRQTLLPYEIVVIDSESTDNTLRLIQDFPINYIRIPHQGVAYARNKAAEACKGDFIAFLDDDCVASINWLEALYRGLVSQGADIAAGNSYFYNNPPQLQYSINYVSPFGEPISPLDTVWWDKKKRLAKSYIYPFFCTLNILIKKELFQIIKFDEYYQFWMEDVDFSITAKRLNFKEVLVPEAKVLHKDCAYGEYKVRFRNSAYFAGKNFGIGLPFVLYAINRALMLDIRLLPMFINQTLKGITDASARSPKINLRPIISTLIRLLLKKRIPNRNYLPYLLTLLGRCDKGAEIGTMEGEFSEKILTCCNLRVLYSIDSWKEFDRKIYNDDANVSQDEQNIMIRATSERLRRFGSRSRILRMTSVEACANFENESLDFIYIDANHAYEFCKKDLEIWWPKLKYGGVFAGHDYGYGETRGWNVKKTVDEFTIKYRQALTVTFEYCPSWYIIKRR